MAWASGARLFKTQGDAWVQTLSDPAREKVVTYWDGLIKKKLVSTIPGFTAEFIMRSARVRSPPRLRRRGVRGYLPLRLTELLPYDVRFLRC
jgi:hypothetical protein